MSNKAETKTLVPKRRFPEFKGNWIDPTLADISERVTQKVGNQSLETVSISAGIGFVSQAKKFSRDISGEQYKNYIVLKKGEFSYNKGNSLKFPQGCVYKLKEFEKVAAPNVFMSFRFKEGYVGDFYQGYFDSNFHGVQLKKFITSGARSNGLLNISADSFFSIKLPTPTDKKEQQKIADCLASVDELIVVQGKKVEALKDHKKGLMQKLFPAHGKTTPAFRFPEFRNAPEWDKATVDNIFFLQDGYAFSSYDFVDDVDDAVQVVRITDINNQNNNDNKVFIPKVLIHELGLNKFMVQRGNLLLSLTGAAGFNFFLWDSDVAVLNQRTMKITAKNHDNDAMRILISALIHDKINVQGSGQNNNLSKETLRDIPLLVPKPKEQQKIADCLSSVDDLITAETQKLDALKNHKKGLMQQLFPTSHEVLE